LAFRVAQQWEGEVEIFFEPAVVFNRILADSDDFDRRRQRLKQVILLFEGQTSSLARRRTVFCIEEHDLPLAIEVREREGFIA
jgi:hypothetical protein